MLQVDSYLPKRGHPEKLRMLAEDPPELVETMLRNILADGEDLLLQRKVFYDNLGSDGIEHVRAEMRKSGERFLKQIDPLLAKHDRDRSPEAPGGERRYAGMGIYYFDGPHPPAARVKSPARAKKASRPEEGATAMTQRRWLMLPLLLAAAACGSDGGSSGTGITTATGNVASVMLSQPSGAPGMGRQATRTAAAVDLAGIDVSIEGTSAADRTDAAGQFVLRGNFDGDVTLRFQRAQDRIDASLATNIPAGGTLNLHDVQIDNQTATATASSATVEFDGLISEIDCAAATISPGEHRRLR